MSKYECQDCGRVYTAEDMDSGEDDGFRSYIHHISERVAPGEPMPAGQCNNCGALVHELIEQKLHDVRDIPASNCIQLYMHCRQCIEELPVGQSPEQWSRNSVGFTDIGVQVWCNRHGYNIYHIDFEGHQHPANTGRIGGLQ